jgi:hypothetical protein
MARKESHVKKQLAFLLVAILVASPSLAQCPAFLIPPKAAVFDDDAGKSSWTLVERKNFVTAMPAWKMGWRPVGQVKIDESLPPTVAACSESDFKTNKKTGLTRLWIQKESGGGLREVWAKTGDLVVFQYEPPYMSRDGDMRHQSAAENLAKIFHAAGLKRDEVANADFKPPEVETQKVFPQDFDKVWSALIETLSDAKWQIESVDKSSGLITTKPAVGGRRDVVCGTVYDKDHKTWLNIFAKKVDAGTRVKINATFHAIKEDEVITCYSNGTTEAEIFKGIEENAK